MSYTTPWIAVQASVALPCDSSSRLLTRREDCWPAAAIAVARGSRGRLNQARGGGAFAGCRANILVLLLPICVAVDAIGSIQTLLAPARLNNQRKRCVVNGAAALVLGDPRILPATLAPCSEEPTPVLVSDEQGVMKDMLCFRLLKFSGFGFDEQSRYSSNGKNGTGIHT